MDDRSGSLNEEHRSAKVKYVFEQSQEVIPSEFTLVTRHRRIKKEGQNAKAGKYPGKTNKSVKGHKTDTKKRDEYIKKEIKSKAHSI